MTRQEIAAKFYKESEKTIANLADRWASESQYEDIADYAAVVRPMVESIGGNLINMTKRPFGFTFKLENAVYQVKMTAPESITVWKIKN